MIKISCVVSFLKEGSRRACNMATEVKYSQRFLNLGVNSTLEESKLAYDEMASCWEKVNL